MKNQKGFVSAIAIGSIIVAVVIIGWVINIFKIVGSGPVAEWTAVEILRVIGVLLVPLGSVMGYFV